MEKTQSDGDNPGEAKLEDPTESLHRQIHPSWIQDGIPSSLAFKPTKKDEGMLSVTLGAELDPEAAYRHHTGDLNLKSAGTWSVTVSEATDAGLPSYSQPLVESPAHGYIDFRGLSNSATEKAAKLLVSRARKRGCQYNPAGGGEA